MTPQPAPHPAQGVVELLTGGRKIWALTDDELREVTRSTHQMRSGLDEFATRLAGAADERELAKADGSTSTTAWLANLTRMSKGAASGFVSMSRVMTDLVEDTREAWAAGSVTTEQANVIIRAIDILPDWIGDEERRDAQTTLLAYASQFACDDLRRLANRIVEVIDPDGADEIIGAQLEAQATLAWEVTCFKLTNIKDGKTTITGILPTVQADILRTALEGLAAPRRDGFGDLAIGGERLEHGQRLGRAFCELIEHLPEDALPQAGGLAATVMISIDLTALKAAIGTATLSTGTQMSAGEARRFACNAHLIPIVMDGNSRVLDMSIAKRLHDRYQRITLARRDGGCCWKGCDRPPAWCEAHHLVPHGAGGPTTVDNGALFCFTHHHLLHDGDWYARMADDGIVEVIPPVRIDRQQRPLRHARFTKLQPRAA